MNIRGSLHHFDHPVVMGIINLTDDSFYAGSRIKSEGLTIRVQEMIAEGVDWVDLGASSSRPGAEAVEETDEVSRIRIAVQQLRKQFPELILSIDTFRASVANCALEEGADLINDISAGSIDCELIKTIARFKCPYILMHMQGTPADMQLNPEYEDVTIQVFEFLHRKINYLKKLGLNDIIVDPGFGFGKTIEQNYKLLNDLEHFNNLNCPILVGLSRKSMIYKALSISPEEALNGTTFANTVALLKGASILRVHDVKEAKELIKLLSFLE